MQFNTLAREKFATINRDVLFYTNSYLNKSDAFMSEDEEFMKAVEMHYTTIKKELFSSNDIIWGITKTKGKIIINKDIDKNSLDKILPPDFLGLLKYNIFTRTLQADYNIDSIFYYLGNYFSNVNITQNVVDNNIDIFYIKYIRDLSDTLIPDYLNQFLGAKLALKLMQLPLFKSGALDIQSVRLESAYLYENACRQDEKQYPFLLN